MTVDQDGIENQESRVLRLSTTFRIHQLVYLVTLFLSAIATFQKTGILFGLVFCLFWMGVYLFQISTQGWKFTATTSLCVLVICLGCICVNSTKFIPYGGGPFERCHHSLRRISWALDLYQANHGSFPPVAFYNEKGMPVHSWRVMILPELGETELYSKYDFSEPWDSPNNLKLLRERPNKYSCETHLEKYAGGRTTSYLAVYEKGTYWDNILRFDENPSLEPVVKGMVVEVESSGTPWTKPVDLEIDKAIELLSTRKGALASHRRSSFLMNSYFSRGVAYSNGQVDYIAPIIPRDSAVEIFTSKMDAKNSRISAPTVVSRVRDIRLGNLSRVIFLVSLTLLPLALRKSLLNQYERYG